ncbi:MAG: cytochrome b/b6 domain-containing protein [Pseudomonadota bacterium]
MQEPPVANLNSHHNTQTAYGSVERGLHWAVAALLITGAVLGKVAYEWPYDTGEALAMKATLFSAHKTVGVSVFFLALFRIGWALIQPRPQPLHPDRVWETRVAATVHWLLYGSLVLVPLTGWIHHAASSGFAPIWWPFGQNLPLVPEDPVFSARVGALHMLLVKVLIVSLLLHIGGTLKHVFVDKDATLPRMWSGRDPGALPPEKRTVLPLLLASVIWVGTMAVGWAASAPDAVITEDDSASVDTVSGNWGVTDGTLSIEVLQMGQTVEGRFDSWTADINFDETVESGPAGTVVAQVQTDSLSLGSVSSDAKGPDFLNTGEHPVATFEANLVVVDAGYVADGTLTLRGESVPVKLPFTLTIVNGLATMSGSVTLDRRSFNIGEAYSNESDVGFAVTVNIDLEAQKRG